MQLRIRERDRAFVIAAPRGSHVSRSGLCGRVLILPGLTAGDTTVALPIGLVIPAARRSLYGLALLTIERHPTPAPPA